MRSKVAQVEYLFHQTDELRDVSFLDGNNSSATWVDHETNTLLQKLDWWQEERNVKKEGEQSSSLLLIPSTAMPTKQNQ